MGTEESRRGDLADAGRANLAYRLGLLLFGPGQLFDRLRERPVWLDVLLLLVALNVVGNLVVPEDLLRQMAARQLPPDADPAALEGNLGFVRTSALVGSVLFTPLWALLVAGFLLVVYNVLLGGEARFRQLFSATVHALFVLTLGGLLTLFLMIASGEVGAALALHLVVPGIEAESWAYRFLHGLNVFGVWTAALLGVAVSRIYPRRGAGTAAAVLIGTYVALKAMLALMPGLSGT